MTLPAGSRLGPYEIVAPLGAGGMGEVWRARDTRLGREVAIKVLPAEVASDPSRLKRFEKEARAASALNHPNIVTIYDIGSSDSVSYISMERVDGKTLRELLFPGPLPMKRLLPIAAQIADGLARAHEAGIVHRDLKPENVMVTKDGLVKILDFGLAKLTQASVGSDEGSHLPTETGTNPGAIVGTVGYMSPEQASGQPVDFRSDQFSLGSILYELATGKRAFQKGTAVDTLSAILHEDPQPIASLAPQAPTPMRWLVERCLAKEPRERYASTEDLARDLASLRDHLSEASFPGVPLAAPVSRLRSRLAALGLALALAAVAITALFAGRRLGKTPLPRFQQLTFRHGHIGAARFGPDSQTIVYTASWDGAPYEIFTTRPGSLEGRPLGIQGSIASVSSGGELALVLPGGTLAQAPLAGGAPRELLKRTHLADWGPDGKSLAVIHRVEARFRLEFPIGKVVYETPNNIDNLHVSPAGDLIAFRENSGQSFEGRAEVLLLDVATKKTRSVGIDSSEFGWSPDGKELWFLENPGELRAIGLNGRKRDMARFGGSFQLDDIARDGRLLIERLSGPGEIRGLAPGEAKERSLSWLDSSFAAALSDDGKTVLINEKSHDAVYLRKTDGSPAVPLGKGWALALSPDGQWALVREGPPPQLVLLPTGAGETQVLKTAGFESFGEASFLPDGRRVLFCGTERGHKPRLYVMDVENGTARPVSPEGVDLGEAELKFVSPDGKLAFANPARGWLLYPLDGRPESSPLPIAGLAQDDAPVGWTADSRSLFVMGPGEEAPQVFRVNWSSGRRELYREFRQADPTGIVASWVLVTPDGKGWVYSAVRRLSELYLVEGIKE